MEFMVGKEFTDGKEFTEQYKKSKWSSPHIVHVSYVASKSASVMEFTVGEEFMVVRVLGTIEKEQGECVCHRVHGRKRVNGLIEKERAELATHSACVTCGKADICTSWSSRSEKSSWLEKSSQYNRKRASEVRASQSLQSEISSQSEKSSWYNRKRASGACHT